MTTIRAGFLLLLALSAAGCHRAPKTPKLSEAMPNIPLPPRGVFVSRSGAEDALQFTFSSSMTPDSIAAYYRSIFRTGAWKLRGDARTSDGGVALYAEQNGPPMWVSITRAPGADQTIITLTGAVLPRPAAGDSGRRQ